MSAHCWGPVLICIHRWKRPRMRCRRLTMSSSDPRRPRGDLRTTNRQDSTDAPAMVGPSTSRIKKLIFLASSKCPIDLFGPVANRTVLKQLQAAFRTKGLVCIDQLGRFWRGSTAAPARRQGLDSAPCHCGSPSRALRCLLGRDGGLAHALHKRQ